MYILQRICFQEQISPPLSSPPPKSTTKVRVENPQNYIIHHPPHPSNRAVSAGPSRSPPRYQWTANSPREASLAPLQLLPSSPTVCHILERAHGPCPLLWLDCAPHAPRGCFAPRPLQKRRKLRPLLRWLRRCLRCCLRRFVRCCHHRCFLVACPGRRPRRSQRRRR